MTLQEIIENLGLTVLTQPRTFALVAPTGGYAADMLSSVMTGAPHQGLWVTLQAHGNIVAVGALLELSAIIITSNAKPDAETINRANHEGVTLLSTGMTTYETVGRLWELGVRTA